MERKGLNPKILAERAQVGRSFVYDILNGKSRNPTSAKLVSLARILDLDVSYLLGNEMGLQPGGEWVEIKSLSMEVSKGKKAGSVLNQKEKVHLFRSDWVKDSFGASKDKLRVFLISGDSMQPTLCNADVVIVDTSKREVEVPGLFVIHDGVAPTARRLQNIGFEKGRAVIRVLSDNPRYAPLERKSHELRIIGRIAWFSRVMG